MNVVVLQGTLSSDPVSRVLASGSVLVSLELTTVVDGCSVSVPVAWFDPPLETAPVLEPPEAPFELDVEPVPPAPARVTKGA